MLLTRQKSFLALAEIVEDELEHLTVPSGDTHLQTYRVLVEHGTGTAETGVADQVGQDAFWLSHQRGELLRVATIFEVQVDLVIHPTRDCD